ncbi:MAG: ATP-dependent Clp protease ATP-binding subunit [Firmicutes bacterium]|nr:ATP-dependent Clp protease ATP-binding subunit [[Eubacterium] siraeum]MCM1489024.1 ATP-dependent Clp protease ATP-binding subunit [Bacillota bacterium]
MMCNRCNKRPAVVFITTMKGEEKHNEGLCLKCAKEMNIPQVSEYIKQLGLTEDELESEMEMLFGSDEFQSIMDDDEEDIDGFKTGGASTMPPFWRNLFDATPGSGDSKEKNGREASNNEKPKSEKEKSSDGKPEKSNKKRKFLDTFCTNLTAKAKRGELDRIIGRDKEIYRITQILSRRTKNNPCLIGEPGVGKTAIAEGIAQKLVAGDVPFRLKGKELYLLDLTALVAGTQFRGQFESRVKSLIDEVKSAGNILLFIDEVHNLVGTGDSEGTMNAANMFKPALSRGELQVIGATTFDEYRKYIEKDSALERRFQPVTVNEPSIEDTVELLKGIKSYYEEHHAIHVTDDILRSCVVLSERYITDRYLPDKAIDLLDESAACAGIKSKDLAEYESLKSDNKELEKELSDLSAEKENIDYERIAEIKTSISKNEIRINELEPVVTQIYITEEDVSKVIELWTGIPATKIMETEFKKIAKLENVLKSRVIGQDSACELVAAAIKRTRVQLSARRRPASFIFVGPTGVGKTELVRVLAEELFDTVDPLIRLDMSEYMEKYSVSKIIGSPPGYIGYDEAGQLTEKVRRKPYSVILFDEIEKAHPDVMNILLQILDEGKVTDSHGRVVSFENTVIAMTSNAGSSNNNFGGMGFGKTEADISKERAMNALKEFLRPEFLGRIDEIVVFNPLTEENYVKIAKLMLEEMKTALAEKKIELKITEAAYKTIASKAYGGKYGGRDIRRVIRRELEDKVANLIVDKGEGGLSEVNVSSKSGELVVS